LRWLPAFILCIFPVWVSPGCDTAFPTMPSSFSILPGRFLPTVPILLTTFRLLLPYRVLHARHSACIGACMPSGVQLFTGGWVGVLGGLHLLVPAVLLDYGLITYCHSGTVIPSVLFFCSYLLLLCCSFCSAGCLLLLRGRNLLPCRLRGDCTLLLCSMHNLLYRFTTVEHTCRFCYACGVGYTRDCDLILGGNYCSTFLFVLCKFYDFTATFVLPVLILTVLVGTDVLHSGVVCWNWYLAKRCGIIHMIGTDAFFTVTWSVTDYLLEGCCWSVDSYAWTLKRRKFWLSLVMIPWWCCWEDYSVRGPFVPDAWC
jgi:hypothetical protein